MEVGNIIIQNIKSLIGTRREVPKQAIRGHALADLPHIDNAYIWIRNGRIDSFGTMSTLPDLPKDIPVLDAQQGLVFPTFCDSHTHTIFAAPRENEFVQKIKGESYEEISRKGGGIINSALRLRSMPEQALYQQALARIHRLIGYGTGAIEIKSGYGLDVASELKMLRIARQLQENLPIPVKTTFLGAHAIPPAFKDNRAGYIQLIIKEMLPAIAAEGLADYIDVFCEKIAFSLDEMDQILEAGARYGLRPKVHVNQFNAMGGVPMACERSAVSVDHLEVINRSDIDALQQSETIATLLPTAPFFLSDLMPNARRMINEGLAVALASDYNPGSSPSGNMNLVWSLACIQMKMLPEEALQAATLNGAFALELQDTVGSITSGLAANLIITKPVPSLAYIPYAFGDQHISKVIINGNPWNTESAN